MTGEAPSLESCSSLSSLKVWSRLKVSLCQLTGRVAPSPVWLVTSVLLGEQKLWHFSSLLVFLELLTTLLLTTLLLQLHVSCTCMMRDESLQRALSSGKERFLPERPCSSAATSGIIPWVGQVLLRRPRRRFSESLPAFGLSSWKKKCP